MNNEDSPQISPPEGSDILVMTGLAAFHFTYIVLSLMAMGYLLAHHFHLMA